MGADERAINYFEDKVLRCHAYILRRYHQASEHQELYDQEHY